MTPKQLMWMEYFFETWVEFIVVIVIVLTMAYLWWRFLK